MAPVPLQGAGLPHPHPHHRYASGRPPKAPFEYHAGAVRAVVVRVDPIGDGQAIATLRYRRWTDRVRFGLGELRYRIADRLTPGSHDGR